MYPIRPNGLVEVSEAPPIKKDGKIISNGSRKTRISFDRLSDERAKISGSLDPCCSDWYRPFRINIAGNDRLVWLNINSLSKRFNLPKKVILKASSDSNLNRILQLAQDRFSFTENQPEPTSGSAKDSDPMLSNGTIQLIPLAEIAKRAKLENRDILLSSQIYDIPMSIVITRDGFIAFSRKRRLGNGSHGVVKESITQKGTTIARRVSREIERTKRLFQIHEVFKGKKGILDTLSTAVYENKMGRTKAVSFHPIYKRDLFDLLISRDRLPIKDALDGAHDLLLGLHEIAKKGMHGDLKPENILTRKVDGSMEMVICDLESFSEFSEKEGFAYVYGWSAPETICNAQTKRISVRPDAKRDVWPIGVLLGCIFLKEWKDQISFFPWLNESREPLSRKAPDYFKQERIDHHISAADFPEELATLLKGMLQVDPLRRWSAQESLDYFEKKVKNLHHF